MKRTIFFTIIFLLMVQFTLAEPGYPNFWRGNVNIDGSTAAVGTRVDTLKAGIIVDTCFTGVDCIQSNPILNMYEVGALGVGGEQIQLQVWGVSVAESPQTHTGTYDLIMLNINMATLANGQVCIYNQACTSGTCTSGICAGPYCGNGIVESGEQCDGGSGCTASCTTTSSGGGGGGGSGGGSSSTCTINYTSCGDWGDCFTSGVQTRTCGDSNNCTLETIIETQNCTFVPTIVDDGSSSGSGSGAGSLLNQTINETTSSGNLLTGLFVGDVIFKPAKWIAWLLLLLIILAIWAYRRYTRNK